jgi:hypothetical protein
LSISLDADGEPPGSGYVDSVSPSQLSAVVWVPGLVVMGVVLIVVVVAVALKAMRRR